MTRRIQLSSRRTGRRRIIRVLVHDTEAALQAAAWRDQLRWGFPPDSPDFKGAGAACCFPYEWEDEDPREHLATIHLSREQLDLTTIMHEVVHAAMFVYAVDCTTNRSRSRGHMNGWNETLAYLASDLYSNLICKFDVIPIGV